MPITISPTAPVVSAITGIVTAIVGFVGYLIRTNSAQNSRLVVLELGLKSLSEARLDTRVTVVEQGLAEIKAKMAKLDLLESMKASLDFLSGQMRDMQQQMVPRAEHQAHWRAIDEKIEDLSKRNHIKDELITELIAKTEAKQ